LVAEFLLRVALVAAVVAVAAGIAFLARRRPYHAPIDVAGAGFAPGLVVFTSTACQRCRLVLAAAKATGAPLREVTFEIEADLQQTLGVTGVPLTLVINEAGEVSAQFAGLVRSRQLRRALRRTA
jgi:hypothetical protein